MGPILDSARVSNEATITTEEDLCWLSKGLSWETSKNGSGRDKTRNINKHIQVFLVDFTLPRPCQESTWHRSMGGTNVVVVCVYPTTLHNYYTFVRQVCEDMYQVLPFFSVQHWKTGSGLGTRLHKSRLCIGIRKCLQANMCLYMISRLQS